MALDRFITWAPGKPRPSAEDIRHIVEDFLGGMGAIREDRGVLFVVLPGHGSDPLRRIDLTGCHEVQREERWIEVWPPDEESIDVLTRQQDCLTNGIANRLAWRIATWYEAEWDGMADPP